MATGSSRPRGASRQLPEQPSLKVGSYWRKTREPVYSLIFVVPLIVAYWVGIFALTGQAGPGILSGADVLMRQFFRFFGVQGFFISGIFVIGVLFLWQFFSHSRWQVDARYLGLMAVEAGLYGVGLVGLMLIWQGLPLAMDLKKVASMPFAQLVLSVGAGVYEEFLFRLVLIAAFSSLFTGLFGLKKAQGVFLSLVLSGLVFAACHHLGTFGEAFIWKRFLFRTTAGLIFGTIYLGRGFGVAAGAHTLYDILLAGIV